VIEKIKIRILHLITFSEMRMR